jgi:TRAP-type C4-dicarboxylate transport system permease small subunit
MADEPAPPRGPVAWLASGLALLGGGVLLATALLTSYSVVQRWITRQPVPGDFELVSLGSGLAVFGFFAYGTLLRANILVDTFTGWLPGAISRALDAGWTLIWAAAMALLAERLWLGAIETRRSGTTTMALGLPTWWVLAVGAACFAATALTALYWSWRLARGAPR